MSWNIFFLQNSRFQLSVVPEQFGSWNARHFEKEGQISTYWSREPLYFRGVWRSLGAEVLVVIVASNRKKYK